MKTLLIHQPEHPAAGDFCTAIDGELAMAPPMVCDRADCGCDRCLVGLNSALSSTTVIVADLDMTMAELVAACEGFLHNNGWAEALEDPSPENVHRIAHDYMGFMTEVAADFDIGDVLRPRYDRDDDCWLFTSADRGDTE